MTNLIKEGLPTTRPERLIHPGSIKAIRIDVDLLVCGSSWIICLPGTGRGAPEAEKLVQLGLHEGPPNQHPGQGTACRRFAFANAMIELIWVSDAMEARSQSARRTLSLHCPLSRGTPVPIHASSHLNLALRILVRVWAAPSSDVRC
jgi:hypothetical protein